MYVRYGVSRRSAVADINLMLTRNVDSDMIIAIMTVAVAWFGGNYFIMRRMRGAYGGDRGTGKRQPACTGGCGG